MAILEKQQIGAGVRVWKSERGQLRTERPAREVCIFRATGHLEVSFVELVEEVILDAVKVGRPHVYWDGDAMTGYDTEFRQRLGELCVRMKPSVTSMNVFTPNRIVAMGAAVINIWVGNFLTIFRDRVSFEDCLQEFLPRRVHDFQRIPGEIVRWELGELKGEATAGADGSITVAQLPLSAEWQTLKLTRK